MGIQYNVDINDFVLVMSGDNRYAFAIGNVLYGLKKHSPNLINKVIIFQKDFSESDRSAILQIYPETIFVDYSSNFDTNLNDIINYNKENRIKTWPYFCYAIFEIFEIILRARYVLYLDGDVLIKKDISEIKNYGPIAMKNAGRPLDEALGIKDNNLHLVKCRNTGVVILNNSYNFTGIKDKCYLAANKYKATNKMPDQSIINLVLYENNIKINILPDYYNSNLNGKRGQFIIHQTTTNKFWNNTIISLLEPEYDENADFFNKLGGQIYTGDVKYSFAKKWKEKNFANKILSLVEIYSSISDKLTTSIISFFSSYNLKIQKLETRIFASFVLDGKNDNSICRYEIWIEPEIITIKLFTNNVLLFKYIDLNEYTYKQDCRVADKFIIYYDYPFKCLLDDNFLIFFVRLHNFVEFTYNKIIKAKSL